MLGIVLPVVAAADVDVVDIDRAVDVDVAAAPIDAAAPVVAARCPAPDGVAGAEGNPGGEDRARHIAERRREVVWRIGGIGPVAVNDGWIVIGHVNRVRHGWFDDDDLLALLLSYRNLLLLGRGQLVVGLGSRPQTLHRIHDIRLLRENGIAQLLRPVELFAHHRQHARCSNQGLHAFVPALLVDGRLQWIPLEGFVPGRPSIRLHDLKRIGRCHQNLGEQRIRIERDRSHQRIELFGLQQLLRLGRPAGGAGVCACAMANCSAVNNNAATIDRVVDVFMQTLHVEEKPASLRRSLRYVGRGHVLIWINIYGRAHLKRRASLISTLKGKG